MNIRSILFITISIIALQLSAQNVGIGTDTPSTSLEVAGTILTDTLSLKTTSNKIYSAPNGLLFLRSNESIRLDAGYSGSPNKSLFITSDNQPYALFDGANKRLGIDELTPQEKLDVNGAIKLQSAENENEGTIQWTGSDFTGYDGSEWRSLTQTENIIDTDADSEIKLVESSNDKMELILNNQLAMSAITTAGGTTFSYFSDPTLGVQEKVSHQFRLDGETIGSIGVSQASPVFFNILGDERVFLTGGLNLDSNNKTNVSIGNHFNTNGVVINTGSAPVGAARALLDVKGKIESDGATFNDVINLTPMPKPLTAETGDIYMDDGTCGPCNGFVRLRYYTGTNWLTVD